MTIPCKFTGCHLRASLSTTATLCVEYHAYENAKRSFAPVLTHKSIGLKTGFRESELSEEGYLRPVANSR